MSYTPAEQKMKKKKKKTIRGSALQISLVISLCFASAILLGASFTPQLSKQHPAALRLRQSNANATIPSKLNSPDGTLNDGEFLMWSFHTTGGNGSAAREDSGGNPGAPLRISTSAPFGTDTVIAIKDDFTTTIAFEGDTFSFSVDFLSGAGAHGDGQALLLLVQQGSDIYGLSLGVTGVQANWTALMFNGTFNQAAFSHIIGPGAPMPDFTSGVPTQFGFAGQNSDSSITNYYDNFHLVSDAVLICTPPPPNMVGWWPGDGNANDISGDNYNGTLSGGVTFAPGKVEQAFTFNGTDGEVILPNSAS